MSSSYSLGEEIWWVSNGTASSLDEGWARWLRARGAHEDEHGRALVAHLEALVAMDASGMLGVGLDEGPLMGEAPRRFLLRAVEDLAYEHVRAIRGEHVHESLDFFARLDEDTRAWWIATDMAIHAMLRESLADTGSKLALALAADEHRRAAEAMARARARWARDVWLLPGLDGTGELFERLVSEIQPPVRSRVLAYDDRLASYDELLDALPRPTAPTVVVGESFGGPLAVRLARREGRRVVRVVLVASFARAPRPLLGAASFLVQRLSVPPAPFVRGAMLGADADDALVDAVRTAIAKVPKSTLADRLRSLAWLDLSADLSSLEVPLTAIIARGDRLVPRGAAEEPAMLARYGNVVVLDGPHLLAQRRPREVADVVRSGRE